ncbi:MAG: hypothetical protein PHY34_05080, partial [Patescibacteria group bacterium]|nr:hypothetical protein [Patescibacteria group bacterium]
FFRHPFFLLVGFAGDSSSVMSIVCSVLLLHTIPDACLLSTCAAFNGSPENGILGALHQEY